MHNLSKFVVFNGLPLYILTGSVLAIFEHFCLLLGNFCGIFHLYSFGLVFGIL